MTERRFKEGEVAEIFERAATMEGSAHPSVPSGEGMTLAELQAIGRDVGIAPQLIADAARAIDAGEREVTRGFLGMPLRVERVINIERRLSDEEWERVVVDLRETFDARGVLRNDGSLRQWTNGNLQAHLEPTTTGQRLRLRTFKGNAPALIAVGLGVLGVAIAGLAAGAVNHVTNAATMVGLAFMAATGVSIVASTVLGLPGWARKRRQQMSEVAARVAELR